MIFKRYNILVFEGLFVGTARIYECPLMEVTFERLSERTKIAALRLGFSPPIHLPERIPWEDGGYTDFWILDGETIQPVFQVRLIGEDSFFDASIMFDSTPDEPA